MLKRIEEKLCWLFKVMIASLLAVMVGLNVLQVITRYVVAVTIIWIEDVSIVCLSWMAAIAVPLLWMMKEHMIMDVADAFISAGFLKWFDVLLQIFGIGAGCGLIYVSCLCIQINKGYVISVAGFDEMWRYVPLLFCGIFLTIAAMIKGLEYLNPGKEKVGC